METLVPCYGRDYNSKKEVEKDFFEGKDFKINNLFSRWDGRPANLEDLRNAGIFSVKIRYGKLQKVHVIKF